MARPRSKSKEPTSFRLAGELVTALQRTAAESGETMTSLAERYLDEGLRRHDHPLIVFREGAAGRRPALAGTRLDVWQVVETVRGSDNSTDAAADYLAIPEPWVRACVRYYADYRVEVDQWIERMHTLAAREEDAWKREQSALA